MFDDETLRQSTTSPAAGGSAVIGGQLPDLRARWEELQHIHGSDSEIEQAGDEQQAIEELIVETPARSRVEIVQKLTMAKALLQDQFPNEPGDEPDIIERLIDSVIADLDRAQ